MRIGSKIDGSIEGQHGDIVLQIDAIEEWVDTDTGYDRFNVLEWFNVSLSVPFAQSNFQATSSAKECFVNIKQFFRLLLVVVVVEFLLEVKDFVGSGDDVTVGDQDTTADVVIGRT